MIGSDQEIIRDSILQREKFLHLSWGGYLASKVGIMFSTPAVQTLFFADQTPAGIQGMLLPYWLPSSRPSLPTYLA